MGPVGKLTRAAGGITTIFARRGRLVEIKANQWRISVLIVILINLMQLQMFVETSSAGIIITLLLKFPFDKHLWFLSVLTLVMPVRTLFSWGHVGQLLAMLQKVNRKRTWWWWKHHFRLSAGASEYQISWVNVSELTEPCFVWTILKGFLSVAFQNAYRFCIINVKR